MSSRGREEYVTCPSGIFVFLARLTRTQSCLRETGHYKTHTGPLRGDFSGELTMQPYLMKSTAFVV